MTGDKKSKIGLMVASTVMMSFLATSSVLAKIAENFPSASNMEVQMIITMPSLLGVVIAPLASKLVQYMYKRDIIIICNIFYLIGGIIPYFIHSNIYIILFGTALMGIGCGGLITVIPALICDYYKGNERSKLLGRMAAFISIGGMFFSMLGGKLASYRWENVFLSYCVIFIIIIIEVIFLPKGKKVLVEKSTKRKVIPKEVVFLSITGFIFYMAIQVYNSNAAMLVEYRKLGGVIEASYATTAYTLAGVVAGLCVGNLIKVFNKKTITISFILGSIGLIIAFFSKNIFILCIGGVLCGSGFFIFTPTGNFFVAECSLKEDLAFNMAIFSSITNLGIALSPVIMNTISDIMKTGVEMNFIYVSIIILLLIIVNLIKYTPVLKDNKS